MHVSSLFEGLWGDVTTRWPTALKRLSTVATCYDLIPLIRRTDYLNGPWKDMVTAKWYNRCLHELASCKALLAISELSRREVIDHIGFLPERIFNIRGGVAPSFAPRQLGSAEAATILARYGITQDCVLFVGGGDLRKNEGGLIRAYALLPETLRARHQLVIVGKTNPDTLAATVAAVNLPLSQVRLVRFVDEDDLPALYSLCAVFVLPSLHEGFGLPAVEAMACGAPTIASENSSLPEVIGRTDALFNAEDPADIAARISQVLTEPAFRLSLIAHGLRQAGSFTWADTAARAWDALEQVVAKNAGRPRSPLRRLPKLALVSPMPPEETGVATYAAELAPALMCHYDLTVVCERGRTTEEPLASCVPMLTPEAFLSQSERFDRVLYQIGNSPFHARQVEQLLPEVPGVVTLHDSFLSGLMNWRAWQGGDPTRLQLDLLHQHGWAAVAYAASRGSDAALGQFPCSLGVLRAALAVVQHSVHARDLLARHYGAGLASRVTIIPHLRRLAPLPSRAAARAELGVAEDAFLVCSFGIVAHTKLPELVLGGFAVLLGECAVAQLKFVGVPLNEVSAVLPKGAATGRVDTVTYRLWLAAADIAVQLRAVSRGESSGAVADCLGAGLPLLVNAYGAAAELPDDIVLKLPAEPDAEALGAALLHLYRNAQARGALGAAARCYVGELLAPSRIATAYFDTIEATYAGGAAWQRWRLEMESASLLKPDELELAAVARAVARTMPTPRPPQLLVAGATLAGADAAQVRAWLSEHPPGVRVHTVRAADDVLLEDWATAAALIRVGTPPGTPPEAEIGHGDVLLLLTPDALNSAALANVRRQGATLLTPAEADLDEAAGIPALLGRYGTNLVTS